MMMFDVAGEDGNDKAIRLAHNVFEARYPDRTASDMYLDRSLCDELVYWMLEHKHETQAKLNSDSRSDLDHFRIWHEGMKVRLANSPK